MRNCASFLLQLTLAARIFHRILCPNRSMEKCFFSPCMRQQMADSSEVGEINTVSLPLFAQARRS